MMQHIINQIKPIIENYCYKCHGQEKQKGDMRFDNIDWDMVNGFDAEKWNMMLNEINLGEMPQVINHSFRIRTGELL